MNTTTPFETLRSLRARLERARNEPPIPPEQTCFPFAERTVEEIEAKIVEREASLEEQRALVFLDIWGSTCSTDGEWTFKDDDGQEHTYRYTSNGAPEWMRSSNGSGGGWTSGLSGTVDVDGGVEPDDCICVLASGYDQPIIPAGYRIIFRGSDNEHECPECGSGCGGPRDRKPGTLPSEEWIPEDLWGTECELCEGSGYLYDPDRTLVVFAPRYSYGSGMSGCMYDDGPYCARSIEDAIDAIEDSFDFYFDELCDLNNWDDLAEKADAILGVAGQAAAIQSPEYVALEQEARARNDSELSKLRASLRERGIHYFTRQDLAGADYVKISDMRDA